MNSRSLTTSPPIPSGLLPTKGLIYPTRAASATREINTTTTSTTTTTNNTTTTTTTTQTPVSEVVKVVAIVADLEANMTPTKEEVKGLAVEETGPSKVKVLISTLTTNTIIMSLGN